MKIFRKLAVLLVIAMVFCFVSCNKGGNSASAAPASNASAAPATTAAPATSNAANQASAAPAQTTTIIESKATPELDVTIVPAALKDLIAPAKAEVAEYKVYASKGSTNKAESFSGLNSRIKLDEGDWTVYAEGFNAEGAKVSETAKKTVKVSADAINKVYLDAKHVEGGAGSLNVRIDTPERANIKNVHISVRNAEAAKDEKAVSEFDLEKQFNWRTFDKFTGTVDGIPSGNYMVVADFTDNANTYLFSRDLGESKIMGGLESVYSHEQIIPGPVFKISKNDNGSKKVDFESDVYDSAIFYTDKSESQLPDARLHIDGERFTGPFDVSEPTEYRAVAVANDKVVSWVTKSGRIEILKAQPPVADIPSGTYLEPQNVKLSTATPGCTIFYTTDGTEPGRNSTLYTDAGVPVNKGTTIKAMAASLDGTYIDSDSSTFNYQIKALPPVSDHADGVYEKPFDAVLSNQTEGCTIYYTTDGTEPTQQSAKYSGKIPVAKNTTIKAIAADNGYLPSDVATFNYEVKSGVQIIADPMPAIFAEPIRVKLEAQGASNADIYYTLNGAEPSTHSTKYTGPIYLDRETDIKAIAVAPGFVESDSETFATYQFKVAKPTANVENDKIYSIDHKMALETTTEGADIIYIVDGGDKRMYTAPISLPSGKHSVDAYGVKDGWIDSDIAHFDYETIRALDPPVIERPSGQYKNATDTKMQRVGMAETLNADIYYTTDDSVSDADIPTKGTKYNLGSTLNFDRNTVLRAVAVKDGYITSSVARAKYDILVKDVAFSSVPIEEKPNMFKVEIECETPGAIIYYTTDGTMPTTASTVYSGAFEVARGVEVQAFAEKEGCISTGVVSYTRKI